MEAKKVIAEGKKITHKNAISEINNTIQNFMCDGSTSKIPEQKLIQSIVTGCLKLCHFKIKVKTKIINNKFNKFKFIFQDM